MQAKLKFRDTPPMRDRYAFKDPDGIYFVTSTVVEWLPAFTRRDDFELLIDSLAYCRRERQLQIYGYVLMDNHLHLAVSGPEFSQTLQAFKRFTAQSYLAQAETSGRAWLLNQFAYYKKQHKSGSTYQVWQEGVHPKLIASPDMLRQKVEYMHNNPVRRGWVDEPEHWRYSSARNYSRDDHSVLQLDDWPA